MQFRIVEGASSFNEDEYKAFEKDYIGSKLSVNEISIKYGLNTKKVEKFRKEVFKRTGFRRKTLKHTPKHIQYIKSTKKYRIVKRINGKPTLFGTYWDINTAIKVKEKLEAIGWDKSQLKSIQLEVGL